MVNNQNPATVSDELLRVFEDRQLNLWPRLSLSREKLRLLLSERNLPAYGNKADLLKRLREFGENSDQWER
jgi:hypothetical protein